jgi:hypothetical protein
MVPFILGVKRGVGVRDYEHQETIMALSDDATAWFSPGGA